MNLKNLCVIIIIIVFDSCTKEDDPYKKVYFTYPHPEDGAVDFGVVNEKVYFGSVYTKSVPPSRIEWKKVYLDTVNPPVQTLKSHIGYIYPGLKTNTTYYWYYVVENVAGETCSEIMSLTTTGFDGHWKIDTMFYPDKYPDSLLAINNAISEIVISGDSAFIKKFDSSGTFLACSDFSYNQKTLRVKFVECESNLEHNYHLQALRYNDSYKRYILKLYGMRNLLIFSKFKPEP